MHVYRAVLCVFCVKKYRNFGASITPDTVLYCLSSIHGGQRSFQVSLAIVSHSSVSGIVSLGDTVDTTFYGRTSAGDT